MNHLPGQPVSLWIDTTPQTNFPSLEREVLVDVVVLGGGIVGLTAAKLLKQAGKTVAVIESRQVVKGTTGHTTAKVTSLHRLIYAELLKKFGEEKTRLYAESNQAAIERIATLITEEQINCDFERKSSYTYTESAKDLAAIEAEVNAALKVGLPATFVQETSLPFSIQGAIRFDHQAQFHPRRYLLALANQIPGDGSYLLEATRALNVEEDTPCRVTTDKGVIMAKDVIVSTNLPILNQGLFFAKTYPKRSYVLAAPIDVAQAPDGMFINTKDPYRSIRTAHDDQGMLLLVGGENHKTGHVSDTEERYRHLAEYARDRFGVESFKYRWSTQDFASVDRIPYIGRLTPQSRNIYVATGFGGWGMTNGTVAGMILKDIILEIPNPWAELYDPIRSKPFISVKFLQENFDVAQDWIGDRFKSSQGKSLADVGNNEGKILTINGEKMAVYRDEQGAIHALSAVCTHLGCLVHWNNAEKSWDCPCHGSRFSYQGQVIHAPAIKDLEPRNNAVSS